MGYASVLPTIFLATPEAQTAFDFHHRVTSMRKFLCLLLLSASSSVFAQARFAVGILPVYDQSAESLTEFLPSGLAMLLYKHMSGSPFLEPVLLGAGGLYDPNSVDWNNEFGRKTHVGALLITRLYPTIRVNDRKRRLKFSFQILDVATGKLSREFTNDSVEIPTEDLFNSAVSTYVSTSSTGFFRSSDDFEKQKLGKAAAKLADWTIDQLPVTLTAQSVAQTANQPPAQPVSATCQVTFTIRFVAKHSIAKGYTVFVNDTDQSSAVKDGIATFIMAGGPIVVRATIPDPPYGVPTEKLYQASTDLLCDSVTRTLDMDIGTAGEAILRWE